MARTVFRMWGINRTDDFGEIVFNLDRGQPDEQDRRGHARDFHNVYDLDQALVRDYRIDVEKEAEGAV